MVLVASYFRRSAAALACGAALLCTAPAGAQEQSTRTRIALGPQVYPSYPGSDDYDIGPLISVDRAKGDELFEFEAPDESFGFTAVRTGGLAIGPVVSWEGVRSAGDVGAALPKIKFSIEPGVFASFDVSENIRLRGEVRKGIAGHKGWIAIAGADAILRDDDRWLFSAGPRVTWSDNRYQDTWFGVAPADAGPSGLPAYDPGGGIQAYGAAAGFLRQLSSRWGIYTYAKYDRLVGDAADSPITRQHGSRDQFSGGMALTYTFGSTVD